MKDFKYYLEKIERHSTDSNIFFNILQSKPFIKITEGPNGPYQHNIDIKIEDKYIKDLEDIVNINNWYIARNRNGRITLTKKYVEDAQLKNIPKYLYHATPTKNIDNILKYGLEAKSKDIRHKYPNRIYVTKSPKIAILISKELKVWTGNKEYSILKIDTTNLNLSSIEKDTTSAYKDNFYIQDLERVPPSNIKILNI